MSEWQPIETAPIIDDSVGNVPVLITDGGSIHVGVYWPHDKSWRIYGSDEIIIDPTHWAPLPALPGRRAPNLVDLGCYRAKDVDRHFSLVRVAGSPRKGQYRFDGETGRYTVAEPGAFVGWIQHLDPDGVYRNREIHFAIETDA